MFDFEEFKKDYRIAPVPVLLMRKYGLSYHSYQHYVKQIKEEEGGLLV